MTNQQPPSDPYGSPDPAGPPPAPGYPAPGPDPMPPAGGIDPTLEQPTVSVPSTGAAYPGGPVPPAGGPTEPTEPSDGSGKRIGLIVAIVILLLVVIAAGVGLALNRKDSSTTATAGTTPGTQLNDAGRTAGGEIEQPAGATTTNPASNTTAKAPVTTAPNTPTAPPTTKAPTSAPTTTKPSVTFASATNNPTHVACPDPSFPGYKPPTVVISWNAPGAKTVALSIDGPGIYNTYDGPTGSVTVDFSCTLNTQGQHTYLLTATAADGQKATKTLTTTWQ